MVLPLRALPALAEDFKSQNLAPVSGGSQLSVTLVLGNLILSGLHDHLDTHGTYKLMHIHTYT